MLNYALSTVSSFLGKASSLVADVKAVASSLTSSPPPSSEPCLIPGQNATGLVCPVNNVTAISADENQCSIYYLSTADIAECMEHCYNCCSNVTQKAIKEAIRLFQATYYQCDQPTPPSPGDHSAAQLVGALIPLMITALISGMISIQYFYQTFAANGISPNNVNGFIRSSLICAGTLSAGVGVVASYVADNKTIGALSGIATAFGMLTLMQCGRANIESRRERVAINEPQFRVL